MPSPSTNLAQAAGPFARGAASGFGFGLAWLAASALYLLISGHLAVPASARWPDPARVLALYLGLGATLPIFVGLWWGAAFWGLERTGWRSALRPDRLASLTTKHSAEVAAIGIPMLALGALMALGSVAIAIAAFSRVRTPWLAASVTVLGILLWGVFLSTLMPALVALARPAARRMAHRSAPRSGRRASLLLFALAVLVFLFTFLQLDTDVRRALPWDYVVSPTIAAALLCTVRRHTKHRSRLRRGMALTAALAILAAGVAAALVTPEFAPSLRIAKRQTGIATAWFALLHRVVDFDGDGALAYFGEGDCAPFDAARGPHALDTPDNGVDEDCTGLDAAPLGFDVVPGKKWHPLPEGFAARPNIILVTTDGLTFGETSLGGGDPGVTPHLEKWARHATVFESAFAASPTTVASLYSLHTGRFAVELATLERPDKGYVSAPTLAEALGRAGYRTHAVLGARVFDKPEYTAIRAGFSSWDTSAEASAFAARGEPSKHCAPEVTERALTILSEESRSPLFLWVHYFDHHGPYLPRDDFPRPTAASPPARERYLREVAFADRHLGTLFEAIEGRWNPDEYVAIFTADHGEAFDVHHRDLHHGSSLHTAELHVPLVIQAAEARGRRVRGLVGLIDLAPTVTNLSRLRPHPGYEGESLVQTLFEGAEPEKTVLFATFYGPTTLGSDDPFAALSVRTNEWYYCRERAGDWLSRWRRGATDADVSAEHPGIVESLRGVLAKKRAALVGALP